MNGQDAPTATDRYIADADPGRRPQLERLDARVRSVAPTLRARIQSGMLAYGQYRYRYASGREGTWFVLGIANNKQHISIHAPTVSLEPFVARLPGADLGRSCIRVKRIDDLDFAVLDEIIRAAAADDGARIVTDPGGARLG